VSFWGYNSGSYDNGPHGAKVYTSQQLIALLKPQAEKIVQTTLVLGVFVGKD